MAHDLPQMVQTFSIMIVLFWNMSFDDYLYQFSSLCVWICVSMHLFVSVRSCHDNLHAWLMAAL